MMEEKRKAQEKEKKQPPTSQPKLNTGIKKSKPRTLSHAFSFSFLFSLFLNQF
jgi:hypothetical protein